MTMVRTNPKAPKDMLRDLAVAVALLTVLICVLFRESFYPNQTLFSNDGPLGAISSEASALPEGFTGAWSPLNWVGYKQPSASPNVTSALDLILKPRLFSKFYAPVSLLLLALATWLLLRQLGLSNIPCILGAIALALNTDPFSYACWGLPSLTIAMAASVAALAALADLPNESKLRVWLKAALSGLAIGVSIMEGFDNGAIFSLYVAAFAFFQIWQRSRQVSILKKVTYGSILAGFIAISAALTSAHTLSTLVGTQIQGVAGMQQDQEGKQQRWEWATQWSLPKIESLRLIIPGIFGYRMDTPDGGSYWGAVGRQAGWEQHHSGYVRHSGSGLYAGVLVMLVAMWAIFQARQGASSVFSSTQKQVIWFWCFAAAISLVLAFGRHAPFYQFFYSVPFFSTIRNPIKFIHPFAVSITILFGYGLQGLFLRYLSAQKQKAVPIKSQIRNWWKTALPGEKKWTIGSGVALALACIGFLLYASSKRDLEHFLTTVSIDPAMAPAVAAFSIKEAGRFIVLFLLGGLLIALVQCGWFAGERKKWATLLFSAFLIVDLSAANQPWIIYYNYADTYASNQILDILRKEPFEHRVAGRLHPQIQKHATSDRDYAFPAIYESWLQHLFQYYNVQSLDIVQMPRIPELDEAFLSNFRPTNPSQFRAFGRLWLLTNTRFILGLKPYLDWLNQELDPIQKRFKVHTSFDFLPKEAGRPIKSFEDITASIRPEGQYAIFEYTGTLPRAKLFENWQVVTNNSEALSLLANPDFNPEQKVLIAEALPAPASSPINKPPGTVAIKRYTTKVVELHSQSLSDGVLLLNDRYDPDWHVVIDSKPASLLRANYIMRGVFLPAGDHTIQFRFEPPIYPLYVSLATLAIGLLLSGFLIFASKTVEGNSVSGGPNISAISSQS